MERAAGLLFRALLQLFARPATALWRRRSASPHRETHHRFAQPRASATGFGLAAFAAPVAASANRVDCGTVLRVESWPALHANHGDERAAVSGGDDLGGRADH